MLTSVANNRVPQWPIGLSVVVSFYDEEEPEIDALIAHLVPICERFFPDCYEIFLIDDGSFDQTWSSICRQTEDTRRIFGIDLIGSHGYPAAWMAGLAHSRGELVLVINAGFRDLPKLLPIMLSDINEGRDVVIGQRILPLEKTLSERITPSLDRILNKLFNIPIPADVGDFSLMTRRVVDQLNALPTSSWFINGVVNWVGFNHRELIYQPNIDLNNNGNGIFQRLLDILLHRNYGVRTLSLRLIRILGFILVIAVIIAVFWVFKKYDQPDPVI